MWGRLAKRALSARWASAVVVWLLVAAFFCSVSAAETGRWSQLTEPVFLPGPAIGPAGRVSRIAQDGEGLLWMVTVEGLMRWDGYDLARFDTSVPDIQNDIRAVRWDESGWLWLGTGRGLYAYDPVNDILEAHPLTQGESFAVLDIAVSRRADHSVVWVGTEAGVFEVRSGQEPQHHLSAELISNPTMRVFAVLADRRGAIWAGTSHGLFRRDNGSVGFTRVALGSISDQSRISTLLETAEGEVWVGTAREGIVAFDAMSRVRSVPIPGFEREWIFALTEVRPGRVWAGSYGSGVIEIRRDGATRMIHRPLAKFSIPHNEVWTIFADRSGQVWVGTDQGLATHDPGVKLVRTIFGAAGPDPVLRDRDVASLFQSADGRLFVGLGRSGVDVLSPSGQRLDTLRVDPKAPERALPGGAVEAMADLPDGGVAIGSNWGLYRYDAAGLRRLSIAGRGHVFTSSLLSREGGLWAGGVDGLWQLNSTSRGWAADLVSVSITPDFTDPRISTLAPFGQGVIAGTWEGINWLDKDGKPLSRLPSLGVDEPELENGYITGIIQDRRGRTWLGTSGAGVYLGEPGQEMTNLRRRNGLSSDVIAGLQQDNLGRVWVSSHAGVDVIDGESLDIWSLGPADGVVVAPYVRQASIKTREGEIMFGGAGGITVIDADQWQPAPAPNTTILSAITVSERLVEARSVGRSKDSPLQISADQNRFALSLSSLDMVGAESTQYRFRSSLNGERWTELSDGKRTILFSGVRPGQHEIEVQASDRYGRWPAESTTVYVAVGAFWHQTLTGRVAIGVALTLAVWLLLRWRTAMLRRQRSRLEAVVAERTRDLEAKSKELEHASLTDPLTGLGNRRFLDHRLPGDEAICVRRYREAGGKPIDGADLIYYVIDIDYFKDVNDKHGHAVGDAVLVEMCRRLEAEFREGDYLVRWGGEEFLAVARGTSRSQAARVASRVLRRVASEPFQVSPDLRLSLTCSVGYCAMPLITDQPARLGWRDHVRIADHALYSAKFVGRNAWVGVTSASDDLVATDLEQLIRQPAKALDAGWITVDSSTDSEQARRAWGLTGVAA